LVSPNDDLSDLIDLTFFRGRVALAAILRGLGVTAGDEVLIQAFTCVAVPEAVLSVGATPTYVDVEPGSLNMNPADLTRKITPSTRAIVVQHSFGLPADVSRISHIGKLSGVPLIEDCAHTVGSRVDGLLVGTFGAAAFYSYEASKPIFVGIGGSARCNEPELTSALKRDYDRYREPSSMQQLEIAAMVVAHKLAYRPTTYWTVRKLFRALVAAHLIRGNYNEVGAKSAPSADFTHRMGRLQARELRRAIRRINEQSAHRRSVATEYRTRIRAPGLHHIPIPEGVNPVFGRYPLVVDRKSAILEGAREAKVEVADFYATPVHPLQGMDLRRVNYEPGSCPEAELLSSRIVSLPTGPQVTPKQVERAIAFFNR
jgi:perosamine synthetase